MNRNTLRIASASLLVLAGCMAAYLFRPVTVQDGTALIKAQSFAWNVGQALSSTGLSLDPHDQVSPPVDRPVPLSGKIIITRAVQAYLWENGEIWPIIGLDRTPRALFAQAGVRLGKDDRLLWNGKEIDPEIELPPGVPLVLQVSRAAPFVLNLEGSQKSFYTNAPSVAGALWDAGVRVGPGDRLSPGPGAEVETGMNIDYRAARPLNILAAGREFQIRSAAETTGAALAEAGFALQGLDYSLPGDDQPLPADGRIRVVRVREEIQLTETLLPFDSQFAPDPELELDLRATSQVGQYGVQVARERVRYEDGQEVSRSIDSDWTAANPIPQTIGYGTKVVTRSEETPDGTIEYWRKIHVRATSYSPCRLGTGDNRCSYTTASGARLTKGIVGVSLKWFRAMRGQRVYIPGYGFGVIGDYGAVSGMWIDLGFDEENFEENAIVGWVDMYFLTPVPATILWTLP